MNKEIENIAEIIISDLDEMHVALRPPLPFQADGYRLSESGKKIEIFGESRKIKLDIPEESREAAHKINQILLLEYYHGQDTIRETDLLRV